MNTSPTLPERRRGGHKKNLRMEGNSVNDDAYPCPDSVKGRVLAALLRGARMTHRDCWLRFGSSRLSHHVFKLRGAGWKIRCVDIPVTTSDGRAQIIGQYHLDDDDIAKAGERGQHYAGLLP